MLKIRQLRLAVGQGSASMLFFLNVNEPVVGVVALEADPGRGQEIADILREDDKQELLTGIMVMSISQKH